MDAYNTELFQAQLELRHRVRHLLAKCAGDVVAGAPQLPLLPATMLPGGRFQGGPAGPIVGLAGGVVGGPGGAMARPPLDVQMAAILAHTELQRALLAFLAQRGETLALPIRAGRLLSLALERHPELRPMEMYLSPAGVERALLELQGLVPDVVRVNKGDLAHLDVPALAAFRDRLLGRPTPGGAGPSAGGAACGGGGGGGCGGGGCGWGCGGDGDGGSFGGGGGGGERRSRKRGNPAAAHQQDDDMAEVRVR